MKIKYLLTTAFCAFMISGCFDSGNSQTNTNNGKNTFSLGETFRFDDLDLTFESDFIYTKVDNMFSEYDGQKVFGIPVKMTNKKNEPHSLNMFFYDCYGPNGNKVNNVASYFDESTSMDWGGNIMSGATATRHLYFLYGGDGSYSVLLNDCSDKITVSFNFSYVQPEPELDKPFVYDGLELMFSSNYEIVVYQSSQW